MFFPMAACDRGNNDDNTLQNQSSSLSGVAADSSVEVADSQDKDNSESSFQNDSEQSVGNSGSKQGSNIL